MIEVSAILVTIILILFVINCQSENVIQTERFFAEIGASNYTYYRFDGEGKGIKLKLRLTTLEGDADLYVGGGGKKPTFDLDQHHFQSTTCGLIDEVVIPVWFVTEEKPIVIGVYGHPSHYLSRFMLEVSAEEEEPDENNGYLGDDHESGPRERAPESVREEKREKSSSLISWEVLISILAAIARILIDILT